MGRDDQYTLGRNDAEAVRRVIDMERAGQLQPAPKQGESPFLYGSPLVWGKTQAAIAGRGASSASSGTVDVYDMDDTGSFAVNPDGFTIEAFNVASSEVATETFVVCGLDRDGNWIVLVEDCG